MLDFYDRWSGLIPIICGVYVLLLAYGILPRDVEQHAKMDVWRTKFGGLTKTLGPIVILGGILQLFGLLPKR